MDELQNTITRSILTALEEFRMKYLETEPCSASCPLCQQPVEVPAFIGIHESARLQRIYQNKRRELLGWAPLPELSEEIPE